jgi:hypothetical protein
MRLTDNQLKIMRVIQVGNPDNTPADLDQLIERLETEFDWYTSKASLQWSLRQLIKLDLVERLEKKIRRQRSRRLLQLTDLGFKVMGPVK